MIALVILVALFAVAGFIMMAMAETEQQQVHACCFMAILAAFIVTLLAMIVI